MKTYTLQILFIFLIASCKKANNKTVKEQPKTKEIKSSTYLCKINGKDWSYNKASGIINIRKN